MDFTRQPIIESVVTPKEGCKLVIRSSKGAGQEEFFVDAVEIVSFGGTFFLRSLEKPKAFLVPATDYEILEVRETRMVLKNVGLDRSIKIGGGRTQDSPKRVHKEEQETHVPEQSERSEAKAESKEKAEPPEKAEPKKRERRRHYRKRRGGSDSSNEQENAADAGDNQEEVPVPKRLKIPVPETFVNLEKEGIGKPVGSSSTILSSLLPPPPTLISESLERYKGNELFKNVFVPKEEIAEPKIAEEPAFVDEPTVELDVPFSRDRYSEDDIFDIPIGHSTEPALAAPETIPTPSEETPEVPEVSLEVEVKDEVES